MLHLALTIQQNQIYLVFQTLWKELKVDEKCTISWKWYFNNVKNYRSKYAELFYKKVFIKFSWNSRKNTCAGVSFLIKVSDWRLEAFNFIKIDSSAGVFLLTLQNFLRTPIRPSTSERLLKNLEMLSNRLIQFVKVYAKTSIQQEMVG